MIEDGAYLSTTQISKAEKINHSYVCRMMRMTLLAPDIVEAVLEGRDQDLMLKDLTGPFPSEWSAQRARLLPNHS